MFRSLYAWSWAQREKLCGLEINLPASGGSWQFQSFQTSWGHGAVGACPQNAYIACIQLIVSAISFCFLLCQSHPWELYRAHTKVPFLLIPLYLTTDTKWRGAWRRRGVHVCVHTLWGTVPSRRQEEDYRRGRRKQILLNHRLGLDAQMTRGQFWFGRRGRAKASGWGRHWILVQMVVVCITLVKLPRLS